MFSAHLLPETYVSSIVQRRTVGGDETNENFFFIISSLLYVIALGTFSVTKSQSYRLSVSQALFKE